jgi:hypothetical protein
MNPIQVVQISDTYTPRMDKGARGGTRISAPKGIPALESDIFDIAQVLRALTGLVDNNRAAARLYVFLTEQSQSGNVVVCSQDFIAEALDVRVMNNQYFDQLLHDT